MDDFNDLHINIDALDFSEGEQAFGASMETLRNVALQIPAPMLPSAWIEANIELTRGQSSRVGMVKLDGFQREIVDSAVDPTVDQISVLKSQQVGYSKLLSWLTAYFLAWEGTSVIIAEPDEDDAQGFYKDNIDPLFKSVAALKAVIRDVSRGDQLDTWDERRLSNGGRLLMRGAASDDAFRRVSSRINCADEVDADNWRSGGSGSQGDKFELLRGRGTDFWDSKLIVGGTPLETQTSLAWREYQASDQRKYFVPCPHCGLSQVLEFGGKDVPYGLKFEHEKGVITHVWYQCKGESGCKITEDHKAAMVAAGEWIPTATPRRPGHRGYHIWAAYSAAPKASWTHICQAWMDAQEDKSTKLQPFFNVWLGQPFDALEVKKIEADGLFARREPYPTEVPDQVVVLTCGVDVQTGSQNQDVGSRARLECSVWGWGAGEESWLIGHWILDEHDVMSPDCQRQLDELLQRPFKKADGTELIIQATAIDMGGHYTPEVKDFCRARVKRNVWTIKGDNKRIGTRSGSIWPRKASRKDGNSWYQIDTGLAKDVIGRRLLIENPGPNYVHFPMSADAAYFEGFAAEERIKVKNGYHWKPKNKKANSGEAWDGFVYALAALSGLKMISKSYQNLSLASDRLMLPKEPIHYDGPDRSAQSGVSDLTVRSEIVTRHDPKPVESRAVAVEQKVAPAVQMAAPSKPVAQPRMLHKSRSSIMMRR